MLDAAREAVTFVADKTAQELKSDRILSLALVKCIEIIGEAATKVTNETRTAYPQIPWADIVGMRHRLIHVYFDVDLERVCDTIAVDLPPLIESLEQTIEAGHKGEPHCSLFFRRIARSLSANLQRCWRTRFGNFLVFTF